MTSNAKKTVDLGKMSAREVHLNISPVVIATTEDKLRLALYEQQDVFRSRDAWVAPLGIFISILLALVTTSFKSWGFSAQVWETVFYLGGVVSFSWLVVARWKRPRAQSIDDFINTLKRTNIS